MKKITSAASPIIAFLLMTCGTAFCQNIPYKAYKTPVFEDKSEGSYLAYTGDDGHGGVIIIREIVGSFIAIPKGYAFERYDANMNKINSYFYDNKKAFVAGLTVYGGKIHVIEYDYEKDRKAYVWYANSCNVEDFEFTKTELFALATDEVKLWRSGGISGSSYPAFGMVASSDNASFAIIIDTRITDKLHRIHVFDHTLTEKFSHVFDVPFATNGNRNINISPDGNSLYMLSKTVNDATKEKEAGGQYEYTVTKITKEGQQNGKIDVGSHFIPSMESKLFKDKLVCTGFYSDKKDYRYAGIGYFEVDPVTLNVSINRFNPFTEQFMMDKYGRDTDKELKFLDLKNIYETPEGDILIDAEEYWRVTVLRMGHEDTKSLHFDDIISVKITRDGNLAWARNINKRQSATWNWDFYSYSSAISGANTYFFINTANNVTKLPNGRIEFGEAFFKRRSKLVIVRMTQDGTFDYEEIPADKNEIPYFVSNGRAVGSSIYFLGRNGKKKQLLKVAL